MRLSLRGDRAGLVGRVEIGVERVEHVLHTRSWATSRDSAVTSEGVDGMAQIHQVAHRRLGIVGVEERTVAALAHAPHQHVELGLEPDRRRPIPRCAPGWFRA